MATREDLEGWLIEGLTELGGRGSIVEVCKHHESDMRASSDLFYTWQYDVRWAANRLRRGGRMKSVEQSDPTFGNWCL
jgi:hypothetical protein